MCNEVNDVVLTERQKEGQTELRTKGQRARWTEIQTDKLADRLKLDVQTDWRLMTGRTGSWARPGSRKHREATAKTDLLVLQILLIETAHLGVDNEKLEKFLIDQGYKIETKIHGQVSIL